MGNGGPWPPPPLKGEGGSLGAEPAPFSVPQIEPTPNYPIITYSCRGDFRHWSGKKGKKSRFRRSPFFPPFLDSLRINANTIRHLLKHRLAHDAARQEAFIVAEKADLSMRIAQLLDISIVLWQKSHMSDEIPIQAIVRRNIFALLAHRGMTFNDVARALECSEMQARQLTARDMRLSDLELIAKTIGVPPVTLTDPKAEMHETTPRLYLLESWDYGIVGVAVTYELLLAMIEIYCDENCWTAGHIDEWDVGIDHLEYYLKNKPLFFRAIIHDSQPDSAAWLQVTILLPDHTIFRDEIVRPRKEVMY